MNNKFWELGDPFWEKFPKNIVCWASPLTFMLHQNFYYTTAKKGFQHPLLRKPKTTFINVGKQDFPDPKYIYGAFSYFVVYSYWPYLGAFTSQLTDADDIS